MSKPAVVKVKELAKLAMPSAAAACGRLLRYSQQCQGRRRLARLQETWISKYGTSVRRGPFRGMDYLQHSVGSALMPKLIGSYEAELHPVLEKIALEPFTTVLDVGCAEGYYAVGFAGMMPGAHIYAYDIDERAQRHCLELAARNRVADRVHVRSRCDPACLAEFVNGRTLIMCDCEGFEMELLDPSAAPILENWVILVELHEFVVPGVTSELQRRFSASHHSQLIDARERDPEQYPELGFASPQDQALALYEWRSHRQQWAFLTPRVVGGPFKNAGEALLS